LQQQSVTFRKKKNMFKGRARETLFCSDRTFGCRHGRKQPNILSQYPNPVPPAYEAECWSLPSDDRRVSCLLIAFLKMQIKINKPSHVIILNFRTQHTNISIKTGLCPLGPNNLYRFISFFKKCSDYKEFACPGN
jgi:hypothetical protein